MAQIGSDLPFAIKILHKGGLVAIPTETVYGLAANAYDPDAVLKVFEVKNRPSFDPLIVHIYDLHRASDITRSFPPVALKLAEAFWPGPLTLLLPKKDAISDVVTAGMANVAIRVPDHPVTLALLRDLPFPLVAPSANPFGYVSPTTTDHVNQQLGKGIDYILDGGPSQIGIESTIIGFDDKIPAIYRLGGVDVDSIQSIVGDLKLPHQSTSDPKTPGMLKSHYSPAKRVVMGDIGELSPQYESTSVGIIRFQSSSHRKVELNEIVLSESGDLHEAARNLFAALRTLDDRDIEIILAEPAPDRGLGRAINDRLRRASAE